MLTLTFKRADEKAPAYEITVPEAAVQAADEYSASIGLANTEHLMMRFLLDNLLAGIIMPRVQHPPEVAAELSRLEAAQAAARAEYEAKRLAPLLPVLKIGGQDTTLPEIEEQLAAARKSEAADR